MNLGCTCLFPKCFCTVYFGEKDKNAVTLPDSAQSKNEFLGEIKKMSKTKKLQSRNKIDLYLLHHRLSHRSTISLLAGYNATIWEDIDLGIYPDPFCTSCQISSMNKRDRSKNPLKAKSPSRGGFTDIIPSTEPKILTSDTIFSNYILIVHAYSKIPTFYGMEKI